jgi:hypothetical protein
MKTRIQAFLVFLILTAVLFLNLTSQAQSLVGTFYLASQITGGEINSPPYPFDPYGGAVPVEAVDAAKQIYVVEDSAEDYAALQSVNSLRRASRAGRFGADDESPDGAGSGFTPMTFTTNDLWLEITGVSADKTLSYLVIHPPATNTDGVYDLYATTNLASNVPGLNGTNWVWLMRCAPGQTNLTVTNFSTTGICFFRLGGTNDSDNDGLPDAYEKLVSHTDPNNPDTDGDGLADGLELQLGFNPLNAYSQDSTQNQKDGAWYLTAITGQSHTRASIALDTLDTYYDSTYGVTVLYFSIAGITTNDQFDIYIQTPSVDSTDTNKVWQDMFAKEGYEPFGYINGRYWFATAWPGHVATNGTVKFAALDNYDRDYDGLPDGYEIQSAHTIVGTPDSANDGVADADADIGQDGLSNLQKMQRGLNPLVSVSTNSFAGNGMPDWFTNYIAFWYGPSQTGPWADPDGDNVPNIVELELGTDPVTPDYWGANQPPSNESDQFASLQFTVNYGSAGSGAFRARGFRSADVPSDNPYFPYFGTTAGPLGVGCAMNANDNGDGTASFDFEIWPLNQSYNYYAPFTATADPGEGELQEPDPADGELYRNILLKSPDIAHGVWAEINTDVLNALRSDTLEYVHAVSMMKIQLKARQIQWLLYEESQGANGAGMALQVQGCENVIEAEYTKITAIDIRYSTTYPDLDWVDRSLFAAGFLSCAASWYEDYPDLMLDVRDYTSEVRRHTDEGGADILSSQIQSMMEDLPGLPVGFYYALDPTVPIFSLYGPLGWYDGY